MDAIQKKELLHLRIEQANEQMLDALAEMAETLFKTWQPEVVEATEQELKSEEEYAAIYAKHLKPMTREEMNNELKEAMADYERGDYVTLEEMEKEAATW
ncbi:MAG: putative transcriptional regulator [Neolewinella sp.]|jgi:predicted transcriptional regulator